MLKRAPIQAQSAATAQRLTFFYSQKRVLSSVSFEHTKGILLYISFLFLKQFLQNNTSFLLFSLHKFEASFVEIIRI